MALRILSTEYFDLTAASHDETVAKEYPWIAYIASDAVVNVLVGANPTADGEDFAVLGTIEISVAAGEIISIYSEEGGKVWVSEVLLV